MATQRSGGTNRRVIATAAIMALLATGCSMVGWGLNTSGQVGGYTASSPIIDPLASSINLLTEGWDDVAPGSGHTCAITRRGELWCWGDNTYGQLGQGSTTAFDGRRQVGSDNDWAMVSSGDFYSCGLRGTSPYEAYCWGRNNHGQLGVGDTTNRSTPTQIVTGAFVDGFLELSAGDRHACAHARGNNTFDYLQCWGDNSSGQLGQGTGAPSSLTTPTSPLFLFGVQQTMTIGAGGSHTCANMTDVFGVRDLWCMGENGAGQLGDGTTTDRPAPVAIDVIVTGGFGPFNIEPIVDIAAGTSHTCVLGNFMGIGVPGCTGDNTSGQLGDGTTVSRSTWEQPDNSAIASGLITAPDFPDLTAGTIHTCLAIPGNSSEAGVWCWGANNLGQAGIGAAATATTPTQILSRYISIVSSQDAHTCAVVGVRIDCTGFNGTGGLGDGTATNRDTLTPIEPEVRDLSLESRHGCQVRVDGSLWCWGSNANGQLGLGDITNRTGPTEATFTGLSLEFRQVTTSADFSCAVTVDDDLFCSGTNATGLFTLAGSSIAFADLGSSDSFGLPPVQELCTIETSGELACGAVTSGSLSTIGSDTDWDQVVTTADHRCAIKTSGTLWCMGSNDSGQLGLGDTVDRSAMTQVGTDTDWALVSAHSSTQPISLAPPEFIKAGTTCATKTNGTLWCWGAGQSGQLGLGADLSDRLVPSQVGSETDWVVVSNGGGHTCGLRGVDAYCWGSNTRGQLGDGTTTSTNVPVPTAATEYDHFDLSAGAEATVSSTRFR